MRFTCFRLLLLPVICFFLLASCAMQRARDAETAQRVMKGLTKEEVFTCMGPPKHHAKEGETEIWSYDSGNGRTTKTKTSTSVDRSFGLLGASVGLSDEIKEKRYCEVQVVMREGRVWEVHYAGPTGGFLTDDEQCAFAVRNCLAE